ncbi:SPOR domain-containing protein [Leptobacterium sp. I13]|uniref:SPOR domain-containing protein n=1 Tax=Leptobacterium meishanense TaxID=3128904 RepID=UPI0030EF41D2
MPYIEENDLVELHKKIDKSEATNHKLQDQIKIKNREISKWLQQRNIFAIVASVLLLIVIGLFVSFFIGDGNIMNGFETSGVDDTKTVSNDSIQILQNKITILEEENTRLSEVKEFYLAKNLLENQKIYVVQIGAFEERNFSLMPKSLTNTQVVKNNNFYSFSLGSFETLKEAQTFRKEVVSLGFRDAFIASYIDGKRIEIEEPY